MFSERRGHIGQLGETIARKHYAKKGYFIIAQNFYNPIGKRQGEIDFIARAKNQLIFVEVKTRIYKSGSYASAVLAVDSMKRSRLMKTVHWFIAMNPHYNESFMRVDLCVVLLDKSANYVRILSNAVEDLY